MSITYITWNFINLHSLKILYLDYPTNFCLLELLKDERNQRFAWYFLIILFINLQNHTTYYRITNYYEHILVIRNCLGVY